MRGFFDEQLELLNTQLIEMGTLIEHSIRSAAEALVSQDIAQAKESMRFDKKVDEKEREIEALCLKASAAPAASGAGSAVYLLCP